MAAMTLFELNGGSLAEQLSEAGPPSITAGFGIAERVPEDGTRHFTLTVATENRAAANDSAALYALMDGHEAAGAVWGANVLAFAHSDMRGGAVQGLEVDVGNLGTAGSVPVTGLNVFAIGPKPSDVAVGILNGTSAGPGGFREGIAFHSTAPGVASARRCTRAPGLRTVTDGVDLRPRAHRRRSPRRASASMVRARSRRPRWRSGRPTVPTCASTTRGSSSRARFPAGARCR
jgi:hypothetical protein